MIKIKGKVVTFTGKDSKNMKALAEKLNLSPQDAFTGMIWEYVMMKAREGVFLGKKS